MCDVLATLTNIAKSYGSRRALSDVSLEVDAGEAVLLVGRNGAGKTTLLRIATGFMDPDTGTVAIAGLAMASQRAAAQKQLGYLPEHAPAPPELTVREHLTLRARQKGASPDLTAVLEAASIVPQIDQRIGTLSKGYRQRVGLADALLGSPPLLILDEPTSGMDPIQTRELRDQLIDIAKSRGVFVSSHAVADLEGLATRIAVLKDGVLIANAAPAAILDQTKQATLEDAVHTLLA
ncbi:MAG: ABC transporter ATP-binding protein [Kofleriaceae bacterium]